MPCFLPARRAPGLRLARLALATLVSVAALPMAARADAVAPGADAAALLADADRYRASDEAMQVETQVELLGADGAVEKERRYSVFLRAGHQSLVLMRSPAEQGQKVLMLGDDFWLLMPSSQRPMRITASQKLLGDASTGDIATLSWRDDYRGRVVGEAACEPEAGGPAITGLPPAPARCWHLALEAVRKGVSYQRVELWIGAVHHEPVRAELYLQSDKLAKRARFVPDRLPTPTRIDAMWLSDELARGRLTRVRYLERRERSVPEAWFNPMYLVRNPGVE